jgi:hypothetical protein
MRRTVSSLLVAVLLSAPAAAEEMREATAGPEYEAGGWFRFLFGNGYRDLWTTPVQAPVLDLQSEARGLRPVREIGHLQTLGLAFEGADGKAYTFRSLHKHPERILPPEWRDRFPAYIVRDATSRTHPGAAVILPVLAEAAGLAHTEPRLVILPNDPALGEHRETFANEFGTFEEYPLPARGETPGFMGATEILSTQELWERGMAGSETRVDSRAYLRARILDLWLDNYDRHGGQWRWMQIPGRDRLQPLPEDPDMALVHHDGQVMANVRHYNPRLLRFTGSYSRRLDGPLLNAFGMDRWLLADLVAQDFEDVARELEERLTDEVIEQALRQMPPAWYEIGGPDTLADLKTRREALVGYALRVYRYYAENVDVHATHRAERVTVVRSTDDAVEVALALAEPGGPAYYRRRFLPDETQEVRIYLHGGDDHVERTGPAKGPIRVRVIAGGGANVVDDSKSGGTDVWADAGSVEVRRGPGTRVRSKRWVDPDPKEERPWVRPRSWGHWTIPQAIVWWDPDIDLLIGGGFTRTSWGFRHHPHRNVQTVRAAFATGGRSGKVEYIGTFRPAASRFALGLHGYASGIERVSFFGFGNDTAPESDRSRYRSEETAILFSPTLRYGSGPRFEVFLGGDLRRSDSPDDPNSGTILGEENPYGTGVFGSLAARGGLRFDTREPPGGRPRLNFAEGRFQPPADERASGLALRLGGLYVPEAWDVVESYGGIDGEIAAYLGGPRAHLAVRVGGRKVWGPFAWFDAAFLGGRTARAYSNNRFAGDASLYGSGELRLWITNVMTPVVPLRLGAFGFAETGRVWYEDEESKTWHGSYGGGLLFQPLGAPITLHATVATGDEGTRFYFGSGYGF